MSDNHDLLNDNDMCSFSGHEAEDMCFNCGDHTGRVGCFVVSFRKLDLETGDQAPDRVGRLMDENDKKILPPVQGTGVAVF